MNFLLDINNIDISKPIEGFFDKLLYGGQMLLIGVLVVFSVLILLYLTLVLFKLLFHDLGKGKKKVKDVKTENLRVPEPIVTPTNEEIVAVIAAAIAMAENEFGGNRKFRVVSFKRK